MRSCFAALDFARLACGRNSDWQGREKISLSALQSDVLSANAFLLGSLLGIIKTAVNSEKA